MVEDFFNVSHNYFLVISLIVVALAFRRLWRLSSSFQLDPQEPPLVSSRIPYVGHLIGLMQQPHRYLLELHTLRIFNGRVYVLNSPYLVQAAFKSRALSFAPLVAEYVGRMDELSLTARHIYAKEGMHERMMLLFQQRMAGSSLKQMNTVAMEEISSIFRQPTQPQGKTAIAVDNLWVWMRNIMTTVTTSTLLGPEGNPWKKDPSLIQSYWDWEAGDISRRTPLAAIKDRSSHQGRIAIEKALAAYFAQENFSSSGTHRISQMTKETAAMQKHYDFSASDMAAAYTQVIHASVMNAVPTTFWVLVQIFSRPELLARLRQEVIGAIKEEKLDEGTGVREVVVEVSRLDSLCPKLMSAFREAHRLATTATLHRRVVEDTYLSGGDDVDGRPYLLKKGATCMIPTTVSLRSPDIWDGEAAAEEFDPERFLAQAGADAASNLRKKAYFPFGGGKELCPGRNFAIAEVMGIMAVLLSGFDILAPDGGAFPLPKVARPRLTTGTMRPDETGDLRATIRRRPGWENVVWSAAAPELTV